MFIKGHKYEDYGITEEQCEKTKEVVSRYGFKVVCDEEEEEVKPDIILPQSENCEKIKKTVSKYGVTAVCEE